MQMWQLSFCFADIILGKHRILLTTVCNLSSPFLETYDYLYNSMIFYKQSVISPIPLPMSVLSSPQTDTDEVPAIHIA